MRKYHLVSIATIDEVRVCSSCLDRDMFNDILNALWYAPCMSRWEYEANGRESKRRRLNIFLQFPSLEIGQIAFLMWLLPPNTDYWYQKSKRLQSVFSGQALNNSVEVHIFHTISTAPPSAPRLPPVKWEPFWLLIPAKSATVQTRVAKCHRYGRYISVIFLKSGVKFWREKIRSSEVGWSFTKTVILTHALTLRTFNSNSIRGC